MTSRFATLALCFALGTGLAAPAAYAQRSEPAKRADMRGETYSADVQHIAHWSVHTGDHRGLPFIVVDKKNAVAVAFDTAGRLIRSTPVLIGMGVGDRYPPGVAQMDMYATKPSQRITPAGRYYADEGVNLEREPVLWVDYDSGIAIHKLPAKRTKQRRHERIRSPDPAQHRITYGCINVLPSFYDQVVRPYFGKKGGIVYVLPDSAPLRAVFNSYDVEERYAAARIQTNAQRPAGARSGRF